MLAGRRDLRLVLSAGLISMAGDWILTIGLIYKVYAVTGSTVASALAMASAFAPQVMLGAVAGVFADRWDRKRTMIAADLLLAAGLLPLLLVRGAGQVWIIFAVMFWEGAVQQFFSPAEQAMVPRLVPERRTGQPGHVRHLAARRVGRHQFVVGYQPGHHGLLGGGEELLDGTLPEHHGEDDPDLPRAAHQEQRQQPRRQQQVGG